MSDSDSDEDHADELEAHEPSLITSATPRVELVADQLNTHVRKLRRLVDDLAAQDGAPATTRDLWGMLAFALGDWKES